MITVLPGKAISVGAMGVYPYSPDIEAACTFMPAYSEEPVVMSERRGNCILVPRKMVGAFEQDYRTTRPLGAINCQWGPRSPEQSRVLQEVLTLMGNGVDHIAECPTGWGKTWLGVATACAMGEATLIVVTKNDLIDSWHKTLIGCGIPPSQIGHVQADKCDYKGKRFVIGMVHSLAKAERYEPDMYTYFGLTIFDETHRMAADTFVEVCKTFPSKHRLGLSATPKRKDGKDSILNAHIGFIMVKGEDVPMKAKVLVKKTGWHVPRSKTGRSIQFSAGRIMGVVGLMAKDNFRNRKIADFVKQAYDVGRTTLVVSDTLEHLSNLFHAIADQGVPGEQIGYYVGGMSQTELTANSKRRVILATYGMVAEGTNCPWWDTGVGASPRSNITQTIGRILRFVEGKKQPVWLDLVDEDGLFKGFHNKRLQQFYAVGAEVVKLD